MSTAKPVYELIELTDEQKAIALEGVETLKLSELTAKVFPGAKPDGRTTEGRSVKAFLAGVGKEVDTHATPAVPLALTDDQKKMVDDLIRADRVKSSVEMAKLVWNDPKVKNLSAEWRAVFAYMKEVWPDSFNAASEEPVTETAYSPPVTLSVLIGMVNSFVSTGDARKTYNGNTLKISEERQLKALMSYLRVFRFKYVASQYEKQVDRDLFISTFVRWAHDKPDLTAIEVDQMIGAADETVNIAQISRSIQRIDKMQEDIMDAGGEIEEEGGKKRKFSMTDVEMINGIRTKHDQAKGRLEKLMSTLEDSRSKRIGQRDLRNNSILNLFDAWRDDPEWRADLIEIGRREKEEDATEARRLRDMDDVIALISGQTLEEAGA